MSENTCKVSKTYKLIVSLFILAFLTPLFYTAVYPHEDWPYTSVPLFAGYITEESPRYAFTFLGEFEDGSESELGYYNINAHWSLMRYFFKYVYGSVESYRIFNIFPEDTPQKFEARMSDFFNVVSDRFQANNEDLAPLKSITIKLQRLGSQDSIVETRVIGFFDAEKGVFVHTWNSKER